MARCCCAAGWMQLLSVHTCRGANSVPLTWVVWPMSRRKCVRARDKSSVTAMFSRVQWFGIHKASRFPQNHCGSFYSVEITMFVVFCRPWLTNPHQMPTIFKWCKMIISISDFFFLLIRCKLMMLYFVLHTDVSNNFSVHFHYASDIQS